MTRKQAPATEPEAPATDPFANMVVTEVQLTKRPATNLPVPDSLRVFAEALNKATGALVVQVKNWTPEQIVLFGDTLRSNRKELFPGKRLRITTPKGTDSLRVALGALGEPKKETAA